MVAVSSGKQAMYISFEPSPYVSRFYNIKREILGLDELTHIDKYAPLSFDKKNTKLSLNNH